MVLLERHPCAGLANRSLHRTRKSGTPVSFIVRRQKNLTPEGRDRSLGPLRDHIGRGAHRGGNTRSDLLAGPPGGEIILDLAGVLLQVGRIDPEPVLRRVAA